MKTINDFDIKDKRVIIRCDFNVPIKDGKIIDDNRIIQSLETINYCLENGAKVILLSHLGRIKEKSDLEKNSLEIVSKRLSKLIGRPVLFIPATRGIELEKAVSSMKSQDIILLQNTRYEDLDEKKESSNDPSLGKYWASLGDIFINDAFGTIHRAHASNVGIATYLPSGIGFLVKKELDKLSILENPPHPFYVILGGAKVSDKIGVIKNLATKADKILIGGGMAFTFLKAKGYNIGKSLLDSDSLEFCKQILKEFDSKIILPVDIAVTNEYTNDEQYRTKDIEDICDDEMGLDLGEKTIHYFQQALKDAGLIVWNGPLGVYEFSKYKRATEDLLNYIVSYNLKTILGGGDIVAAAANVHVKDKVYHASTGGGATLEYLEGKKLPGLEAIK